jgi:hypothetical protein
MKKIVNSLKTGLRDAVDFVDRKAGRALAIATGVGAIVAGSVAQAQTDATVIATNAQTAFGVIAPITITIAGFYVILKIAKKVVH